MNERSSLKRTFFALSSFSQIALVGVVSTLSPSQGGAQVDPTVRPAVVMPEPSAPITQARQRARDLFRSLTGVAIPIDDPRLKSMETLLTQGKDREAVQIATSDPMFYDIRVRDMARKMSNREESVRVATNDFVATFVGVVRDSDTMSAKTLLTGNFVYRADPAIAAGVPMNADTDLTRSNNHYVAIDTRNYSLAKTLRKIDGQTTMVSASTAAGVPNNGTLMAHPNPAGLLTTRQWVAAHAVMGTNRRLVEFTFRQFMCQPISQWADISQPKDRIGRDVDRAPGGDSAKFENTCRGCHSQMDGLRGAFAKVDFNPNTGAPLYYSAKIADKMNRNNTTFPGGYTMTNDSFVNFISGAKNVDAFGWSNYSPMDGRGMTEFGQMIADSKGFSRCMVQRVFSSICKRDSTTKDEGLVRTLADNFEQDGYHMRRLFETVALRPECLGMM